MSKLATSASLACDRQATQEVARALSDQFCEAPSMTVRTAAGGVAPGPAVLLLVVARRACPELQPDGRALEAEGLAQAILQVALVREVVEGGVVHEEHERRWAHLRLGRVEDLHRVPLADRRRMALDRLAHDLIELGG